MLQMKSLLWQEKFCQRFRHIINGGLEREWVGEKKVCQREWEQFYFSLRVSEFEDLLCFTMFMTVWGQMNFISINFHSIVECSRTVLNRENNRELGFSSYHSSRLALSYILIIRFYDVDAKHIPSRAAHIKLSSEIWRVYLSKRTWEEWGCWVVIENVCGIHKLQTIFERWQKIKQMR